MSYHFTAATGASKGMRQDTTISGATHPLWGSGLQSQSDQQLEQSQCVTLESGLLASTSIAAPTSACLQSHSSFKCLA